MKKLHSRIVIFRKLKGMSRVELTKRINVSYPSMMRYEKGEEIPRKDALIRLCALFDCDVGDLFFLD